MRNFLSLLTLSSTQTVIRAVLKIGGGYLLARGLADEDTLEAITAGALALVAVIWGLLHRGAAGPRNTPPAALILILGLAVASSGCASFTSRAFYAEKLTADTAYASLTAWKAYYAVVYSNAPPETRLALSNRNAQVYTASRTVAAALVAADALREACATNSAASNRSAFELTLSIASDHASNLVWLVRTFPRNP